MDDETFTINSLSDYIEQINRIHLTKEIPCLPSKLLFRGHSDKNYDLVPSLGRLPAPNSSFNSWQFVEQGLIQTAQQKFPHLFSPTDYPAILLAKLQHYGIYTRMLDLTNNALVALYFACCSHQGENGKDGEVLAFSTYPVSAYNPYVNAIADTYRLTGNSYHDLGAYCYKITRQFYYSCNLYPGLEDDLAKLEEIIAPSLTEPMFIEVGNICERQNNQGGYFLLFPNDITSVKLSQYGQSDKKMLSSRIIRISKNDKMIVRKIIIPKEIKAQLLQQLTHFGITTEFLFADSVDDVCKGIIKEFRQHYPD